MLFKCASISTILQPTSRFLFLIAEVLLLRSYARLIRVLSDGFCDNDKTHTLSSEKYWSNSVNLSHKMLKLSNFFKTSANRFSKNIKNIRLQFYGTIKRFTPVGLNSIYFKHLHAEL